jgi:hypothetical protein
MLFPEYEVSLKSFDSDVSSIFSSLFVLGYPKVRW